MSNQEMTDTEYDQLVASAADSVVDETVAYCIVYDESDAIEAAKAANDAFDAYKEPAK